MCVKRLFFVVTVFQEFSIVFVFATHCVLNFSFLTRRKLPGFFFFYVVTLHITCTYTQNLEACFQKDESRLRLKIETSSLRRLLSHFNPFFVSDDCCESDLQVFYFISIHFFHSAYLRCRLKLQTIKLNLTVISNNELPWEIEVLIMNNRRIVSSFQQSDKFLAIYENKRFHFISSSLFVEFSRLFFSCHARKFQSARITIG